MARVKHLPCGNRARAERQERARAAAQRDVERAQAEMEASVRRILALSEEEQRRRLLEPSTVGDW